MFNLARIFNNCWWLLMNKKLTGDRILIIGGNGFLGRFITQELAKTKAQIVIAARHASDAYHFQTYGDVGQIALKNVDATDTKSIEALICKSTIVINLVGILFETKNSKFDAIHRQLPSILAKLCTKHKVRQFIHISANNVDKDVTSSYARSKFAGENEVLYHYSTAVIIRPNVIFGEGDNFLNKFKWLSSFSPVLPLVGGGRTIFQPVYAGDIAILIRKIIEFGPETASGEILEVSGPNQIQFRRIVELILKTLGRKRFLINLPFWCAKIKASFLEFLPNPLLTRDQVELLKNDHIIPKGSQNALDRFEVQKTPLKAKINNILEY